jgi:hypothetical protein
VQISIEELNKLSNREKAAITYNDLKERKIKREKEKEKIIMGYYGKRKIEREGNKKSKYRQTYKKSISKNN